MLSSKYAFAMTMPNSAERKILPLAIFLPRCKKRVTSGYIRQTCKIVLTMILHNFILTTVKYLTEIPCVLLYEFLRMTEEGHTVSIYKPN